MAIQRLNHAVLDVRYVAASVAFYTDVLGFSAHHGNAAEGSIPACPGIDE